MNDQSVTTKPEQPAELCSSDLLACTSDAEIGARWRKNSSLEEWFPFSAQKLKSLEAEVGNAAALIVANNQDKARMDWLLQNSCIIVNGLYLTRRESLDAAMQANDPSSATTPGKP